MPRPPERDPPRRANPTGSETFELVFQPDPTIYDGSFANNGWLQELPKPLTKLTWDNAALMSPATAKELGVGFGEYAHGGEHGGYYMPVVTLEVDGRSRPGPRVDHAGTCRSINHGVARLWPSRSQAASEGCRKAAASITK